MKESIKITKVKELDRDGRVMVFEQLSISSMPKWKALSGHKESIIKYWIFNGRNRTVAQVRNDDTLMLFNDSSKHKVKGWSLQQIIKFVYLMSQKPKSESK